MHQLDQFPKIRLRRLRQNEAIRGLIRETDFSLDKLILPLFIRHGESIKKPIQSMPGHYQFSTDVLYDEIKEITALGIKSVILFGIPAEKNALGTDAYSDNGIIQTAIPIIKQANSKLLVLSDACFCEYMDHGHCGVISNPDALETDVDNDQTLKLLVEQAVSHAKAGADIIAPSGNIDGMVQAIRDALDQAQFMHIPVLSYAVKYASTLYGPFREAAEGKPLFGDRRTYQMDFANANEAIRECALDVAEGADMLMVKPAHTYLDIMLRIKQNYPEIPLCAYHTSGEYAMIKAAAEKGWLDEKKSMFEVLTAMRRAGADFIITYFAKDVASFLTR